MDRVAAKTFKIYIAANPIHAVVDCAENIAHSPGRPTWIHGCPARILLQLEPVKCLRCLWIERIGGNEIPAAVELVGGHR
jgi:hypothetical protein